MRTETFPSTTISFPEDDTKAIDMHGKTIKVGSWVKQFGTIRNILKEEPSTIGKVKSLAGMHGRPHEPMVWIDGRAAHHPQACEVFFPETDA